jgi:hypothetical protein
LHEPLHLILLGAGHDLKMQVAAEPKFFTKDLGGIQNFILCVRAARRDP